MPAYLVHRIAGEKAAASVTNSIPDEASYILGLQGGDVFYYRFHLGSKNKSLQAGYALHEKRPRKFFETSMRLIKGSKENALISYFCGYIVHYCVDKAVHPFVFARAKDSNTHNALEFMLDAWYYKDIKNQNAYEFDVAGDFGNIKLDRAIGDWYRKLLKEVYGIKASKKMPLRAQRDFAAQKSFMQKDGAGFKIASFFIRLFTGMDVRSFMHPKIISQKYFNQKEYDYLKETIENAAAEAAQKIGGFLSYMEGQISLEEAMKDYSSVNFKGEYVNESVTVSTV